MLTKDESEKKELTMPKEDEMKKELRESKIRLYHLILSVCPDDVTENEASIGYYLAKDKDIQDILERHKNDN